VAEVLIEKAIDGRACRAGNTFNDLMWNEGMADAVLKHCEIEDDVSGGQQRKRREKLFQRKLCEVSKRDPVLIRTKLFLCLQKKPCVEI